MVEKEVIEKINKFVKKLRHHNIRVVREKGLELKVV